MRGQVVGAQLEVERAERLGEAVAPARADQRHDVLATASDPGDRDLGNGGAALLGDAAQGLDERQVVLEVLARKRGLNAAEVPVAELALGAPVAAQQAARQDAVGRDRRCRAHGRPGGSPARSRARSGSTRSAGRRSGGRRRPAGSCPRPPPRGRCAARTRPPPAGDRADGLLDRHGRVDPRGPVDVDVVRAEPAQRVGQEVLHRLGPVVDADPAVRRVAEPAELDADRDVVARRGRAGRRAISISLWPMP